MAEPTTVGLVRGIGRWSLVALVVNSTIGAGIFGLPSKVYALTGTYSLFAFLLCALLNVLVVLCFAEVSSRFEEAGGPYRYAREALGPTIGFEVGWLLWLRSVTSFAALTNLFVAYLGFLLPAANSGLGRAVAIATVGLALTAINLRGVRQTATACNLFTLGKLLPLLVFVGIGLFAVDPARLTFSNPPLADAVSASVLLLVFAFAGFDTVSVPAAEFREPRKNLPFAMLVAIAAVTLLYVLIQVVCIGTLPALATSERPLADAGTRFLGPAGAAFIATGALVSTLGAMMVTVLAAPRVLFALSERRQLPRALAATHPVFRTPHVAIAVTSVVMLTVALTGTFLYAITINAMIRLITYVTTSVALLLLRRRGQARPAEFKLSMGGLIASATLLFCLWLLSKSTWREARDLGVAALIGLVIYGVHLLGSRRVASPTTSPPWPTPPA